MIRRLAPISADFCGSMITANSSVRNFGVWFDSDRSFATHTDGVVRRCTGSLCGLSHSRHSLPQSVLVTLVQSLVFSVLRLQYVSVYSMLRQYICSGTYHTMTVLNKMLATSEPQHLAQSLVTRRSVCERETWQSEPLAIPAIRSESGRRRFTLTAASRYNGLPVDLSGLSHPEYKRNLRDYIQKQ